MVRLLTILIVASLACRYLFRCWPWELAGLSARSGEEARARALLGLPESADRDEIINAHRRLVARVHPDKGGTGEQVVEANAARDLLLAKLAKAKLAKEGRKRE